MTVWYCPDCRRWFHTLDEAAAHDCNRPPTRSSNVKDKHQ